MNMAPLSTKHPRKARVVVDRQMDMIKQAYSKSFPGMNESVGISFVQGEIGGNDFWEQLSQHIQELNYIVVCMGDDRINLRTAVDLVQFAYRQGKDLTKNFVILIAQENPSHLDDVTLQHYNAIGQYHNCIRTFGYKRDVWTYDNMTNESLKARARNFFAGYRRLCPSRQARQAALARLRQLLPHLHETGAHRA